MKAQEIRPLEEIKPHTRKRIEQAVLNTFSQREFHRVSLIEIATGANVSLQTIYKYYGSKESLLFNSLDTWLGDFAQRMIDHLQGIHNHKDRLRKVFWVMLDYFENNPKVAQIILSSVYLNTWRQDDTFRQQELMNLFVQVLSEGRAEGVLSDEVDEVVLLDIILGVVFRVVFMWIIRGQEGRLTDQSDILFEMVWRAIAQPEARRKPAAA